MNFYQELQLNQAGSKSYIASFKNPKDKCKHIAVYLFNFDIPTLESRILRAHLEFFSSMVFLHLVRSCLISLPPDCHSASISSAFSLWH